MKITSLVTGGAGFIGAHVTQHLIGLGHDVIILDDLSGGSLDNVHPKAKLYTGSITDTTVVNTLFKRHQFTYVYHLAAYAAEGLSHFIRKFNYENNLIGSIHLINAAINHNIKCFVFTSSIAVYGTNTVPLTESQHPKPEDLYGIAKYAVEQDLHNALTMFGLNHIIFRPHNVYGSYQNIGDKYRNVVGIFMNQILKKEPLTIFGDGTQSRAFSHINDVAPYIANAVHLPKAYNEVFNIGGDTPYTVNELASAVSKAMNAEPHIQHLQKREEVTHAYADHTKFNHIFTPKTRTSLIDGLQETAIWVQQHGARQSSSFEHIEIQKKLPPSWV